MIYYSTKTRFVFFLTFKKEISNENIGNLVTFCTLPGRSGKLWNSLFCDLCLESLQVWVETLQTSTEGDDNYWEIQFALIIFCRSYMVLKNSNCTDRYLNWRGILVIFKLWAKPVIVMNQSQSSMWKLWKIEAIWARKSCWTGFALHESY